MSQKHNTPVYNKEHMARAVGRALPISTKQSIEICKHINHLSTSKAKDILEKVAKKKQAIPFTRFNKDMGHKKEIGPGRYPLKAAQEILKLIQAVEANAQFKGLNTTNLVIEHMIANVASRPWHYGRQRRRKAKRTNIEIVIKETVPVQKKEKKMGKKKEEKND